MKKTKNQKGSISLFVLLSMLFLLSFIIGAFSLVNRRNAAQLQALKETQEIYKTGGNASDIYDSILATGDTVIPVATKEQLAKIVEIENRQDNLTANYMIDGNLYTYKKGAHYILTNDIILDLKTEVNGKKNITIYDYMLYSSSYNIDNNGHDIYYAQTDGSVWKCVCYQNMGTQSNKQVFTSVTAGESYEPKKYSILRNGLDNYKQQWAGIDCFEFMLMYNCTSNYTFDTTSKYNRWRQINNPSEPTNSSSAEGYNVQYYGYTQDKYAGNIGIQDTKYYFSGLMPSYNTYYYLSGNVNNLYYYYPVANMAFDGYYGINVTSNLSASECLLFVRVR